MVRETRDNASGVDQPQIPHREPARGTGSLEAAIAAERNPIRRFLIILGPGFISGAADDDPSGIGTYATAGASLGYATLWTALLTFPLMAAVQLVCAKIGMVTGKGLAGVLRQHYPRQLLYAAVGGLFVANTINVGADLAAIGAAINLLVPALPIAPLVLPIALGILALFFTAVINGFVAPPLLVMIMLVGNNKKIMGKRTNSRLTNVLGWGAAAVMFLAAGVLVLTSL